MQKLRALERALSAEGGAERLEGLPGLYELCEAEDLALVAEALKAIGRVLALHRGRVAVAAAAAAQAEDEAAKEESVAVAEFLKSHTDSYHTTLVRLATCPSARAQVCAVRMAFATLRGEAEEGRHGASSRGAVTLPPPERRIQSLISALLVGESWNTHVVSCLMEEFVQRYVDVRHYVVGHLRSCADQIGRAEARGSAKPPVAEEAGAEASAPSAKRRRKQESPLVQLMREKGRTSEELFSRLLELLREVPEPSPVAKAEDDAAGDAEMLVVVGRPAGFYLREFRRIFQDAWLELLSLRPPLKTCTSLLQLIPSRVLPYMTTPLMLADFYLRAFDSGSTEVSVLSLSGLLVLLTQHGLGDPESLSDKSQKFYTQLYGLIKAETFALKKRARFQRLLAASLSSGLLPARFAAVFAKRCLHVAVCCTEPGTIMWLMAVAYSLIQKHHSHCRHLLSRPSQGDAESTAVIAGGDPFDTAAPLEAALETMAGTYMWEVQVLRRHHLPAISTLAKVFLKPFFKVSSRKLDPELFLDQSFERMYEQAMKTGERQVAKLRARGEKVPVSFRVEEDELASKVFGWAGALSTMQRQVGLGS